MNGRKDRILIPSAVALIAIGTTLWLASGGTRSPTDWFSGLSCKELEFLFGAGIVSGGIGYLGNALFTLWMLCSEKGRFIDFSKLESAFGLSEPKYEKQNWCQQRKEWQEELLNEFHLRLHSHAPQSLIDYCSRRNSAWYIANTSGIASILGCSGTVLFLLYTCRENLVGVAASIVVFVIVIPPVLFWQGNRWNREFWGVCWKWIAWDQQTHPLPEGWLKIQQKARENTIAASQIY